MGTELVSEHEGYSGMHQRDSPKPRWLALCCSAWRFRSELDRRSALNSCFFTRMAVTALKSGCFQCNCAWGMTGMLLNSENTSLQATVLWLSHATWEKSPSRSFAYSLTSLI